ncbi:MAG: hypothetical protein WAU78_05295 [Roseiarcus sp.]
MGSKVSARPQRPKALDQIATVNEPQRAFGNRLGVDISGRSLGVAAAMIDDALQRDFWGKADLGAPTTKQVALAAKFGHDISEATRRVGNAIIDDFMLQLNREAICKQNLEPGAAVINEHDRLRRTQIISSIADNGTVYFRGGNGAKAWARNLLRSTQA